MERTSEIKDTEPSNTIKDQEKSLIEKIRSIWAWLFLIILVVFLSFAAPSFLTAFNIQSVGANMAILLIMAIGQTFVIIAGGIDLSTGYTMGLASVVTATAMMALNEHVPTPIVVLISLFLGLITGLIVGLVNGTLVARFRVPPFIATLGMMGIARGLGFIIAGGMPVSIYVNGLGQIGNGYLLYYFPDLGFKFFTPPPGIESEQLQQLVRILPNPLILMLFLAFVCHFFMSRTRFGKHTYAIGGNRESAIRAGIPVTKHTIRIYVLSAIFASIAGLLYVTRFTNGAANSGEGLLLDSIGAVVIGGASLNGGAGTILGTLIGALVIAVLQNGLVLMGVYSFWQFVAVGAVIILAVLIDQFGRVSRS